MKEEKIWTFWQFWRESWKFWRVDFLNLDVSNPFKVIVAYRRYKKIFNKNEKKNKKI